MPKVANLLTLFVLLLVLGVPLNVFAQSGVETDPSKVDLRALERDIFAEINSLRTDPKTLLANLLFAKQNAKQQTNRNDWTYTLPDTTIAPLSKMYYLDTAIGSAQTQVPVKPLLWSDALAQVTRKYAERNPQGHFDFGTTLSSRAAESGSWTALGENINYGGTTGLDQVYSLYIDDGVPDFGHRNSLKDPKWTHVGVGCFYKNKFNNITCVVNYATDWVDKSDMPKLEVGKQYALREGNTFRYFKLTSTTNRAPFPIRIDVCPKPGEMGWINMPDAAELTSVEAAQAAGLVAANEPCDKNTVPHGILNNGTSLAAPTQTPTPTSAGATSSVPTPTPTGAAQVAPTQTPAGATQVAPTQASANATQVAPTQASAGATQVAPTQAPAGATQVAPTQTSSTSAIEVCASGAGIGQQFALRVGTTYFQYGKMTHIKGGSYGVGDSVGRVCLVSACPLPVPFGEQSFSLGDPRIMTIAEAKAAGLVPVNEACSDAVAPPYVGTIKHIVPLKFEKDKQYAIREGSNDFRYYKKISEYQRYAACPDPGRYNQINVTDTETVMTVQAALDAKLNPLNQPCNTTQVPYGN